MEENKRTESQDQDESQNTAQSAQTQPKSPEQEMADRCNEYLANWKRTQADYDNLKKQLSREKDEYAKYATFRAVEAFLPAADHFAEALRYEPTEQNWKVWTQGIKHIHTQFTQALKELGLEEIKAIGESFNPERHESVGSRAEEGKAPGIILEMRQTGYQMQGKVLRPAKVIIAE